MLFSYSKFHPYTHKDIKKFQYIATILKNYYKKIFLVFISLREIIYTSRGFWIWDSGRGALFLFED
ncbi:hypothetical protein CCP3SC1AL1_510018 [Gammaproteobacteria bacterium]